MSNKYEIVPGWVFRNLNNFGNCLIPNRIIKEYGVDNIQGYLSVKMGEKITIRQSALYTTDATRSPKRIKKDDIIFIAEIS